MSKEIPGVPETITRTQLREVLEPLGLDINLVTWVRIDPYSLTAEVISKGPDGKAFRSPEEPDAIAKHLIVIKVEP